MCLSQECSQILNIVVCEAVSSAVQQGQGSEQLSGRSAGAIRLRTRTFAAKCLLELPDLVGADLRHVSAMAAQVFHDGNIQFPASLMTSDAR